MFIQIEYIQKELQNDISASHIRHPANLLAFKIMESSITELDDTVIYLCRLEDIREDLHQQIAEQGKNFMLFDTPAALPSWLDNSNHLICHHPYSSLFSFVNKLGNIFLTYNNWEQKLMKILSDHSSFQDMIDAGYELIQVPMAMMNVNHQILAITDISPENDTLYFCMQNGYGYYFLNIINRSNPTLDEVEQTGVAEVINNISGNRLRVYRIRINPYVSYYIGFHKQDKKAFHPGDILLFDYFVRQLEKLAALLLPRPDLEKKDYSTLLEEMILAKDMDTAALTQTLKDNDISNSGTWQLLCLRFTNYLKFRTTRHYEIMSQIQQLLPDCHCTLIQSHIAILLTTKIDIQKYILKLQYILITNDAICACSLRYFHLSDTKRVWEQLMFILDQQSDSIRTTVLYYEDYCKQHCIQTICNEFPKETLIHSSFSVIQSFDEKNNTDYLHTLICYLQNNCSMNNTAEILNIHRNSLLYRIRRIEELLDFEISTSPERPHMLFSSFLISQS